jgi:hypothetical protein
MRRNWTTEDEGFRVQRLGFVSPFGIIEKRANG